MSNFDSWNRRRGALDSFGKMSMFDEMDKLEARARARDPNSPIPPDAPGDKSALYGFTGVGNQQFNQLADMMRVHWSKGRGPMGESEPEDFQQEWGDLPYSPIPPDAPGGSPIPMGSPPTNSNYNWAYKPLARQPQIPPTNYNWGYKPLARQPQTGWWNPQGGAAWQ